MSTAKSPTALLHARTRRHVTRPSRTFALQTTLTEHLATIWQQPDEGIWEVRGDPQQFTYSKVMAWVAFDRVVKMLEKSAESAS